METSREAIKRALRDAESGVPGIQPVVLMNRKIDHSKVAAYQQTYLNDAWAPKTEELMKNGFIVFRIQTELSITGHHTMIYLAKMETK